MKESKRERIFQHNRRWLKNCARNFIKWGGFPESADAAAFEEDLLFLNGICSMFPYKNEYVNSAGAVSGVNRYRMPKEFTVANTDLPSLHLTIGKDCVVCYNTTNYWFPETLQKMIDIYAWKLTEIDLSVDTSVRNSRVCVIPIVKDEKEAIRVSNVLQQMYDGDSFALSYKTPMGSNAETSFLFPIKAKDNIVVSELADARRCILADFYSMCGVKVSAVDKRERVLTSEMDSNSDQIKIAGDILLKPRQRFADEANKLFGLNITVELNKDKIADSLMGGVSDGLQQIDEKSI